MSCTVISALTQTIVIVLSLSGQVTGYYLTVGIGGVFPYPVEFITHKLYD